MTSRPPIRTAPASGASSPATTRSAVDFPEPDGPSTVTSSPGSTVSESDDSADASPSSHVFVTPSSDERRAHLRVEQRPGLALDPLDRLVDRQVAVVHALEREVGGVLGLGPLRVGRQALDLRDRVEEHLRRTPAASTRSRNASDCATVRPRRHRPPDSREQPLPLRARRELDERRGGLGVAGLRHAVRVAVQHGEVLLGARERRDVPARSPRSCGSSAPRAAS